VSLTGPTELEIRTPLVTAFVNVRVKLRTPDTDLRGTSIAILVTLFLGPEGVKSVSLGAMCNSSKGNRAPLN